MQYVFISYSSKNQEEANSLRCFLNNSGIKTWMAPYDIPPGSIYAKEINRAIRDCAMCVLLLSNEAQNSIWVAKEVERVIHYQKILIPISIEDVILNDEFEFYISTNQILSIKKLDIDSPGFRQLISIIHSTIEVDASNLSDTNTYDDHDDSEIGTIIFGNYHYSETGDFAPIEWVALKEENDRMLLISKNVIDIIHYHENGKVFNWSDCSLRLWLNSSFLKKAFSDDEANCLIETERNSSKNIYYSTSDSSDNLDKIFILSIEEIKEYLPTSDLIGSKPTPYARAKGVFAQRYGLWWVRTPGEKMGMQSYINAAGDFTSEGCYQQRSGVGIRVAIWVKKESFFYGRIKDTDEFEICHDKSLAGKGNDESIIYSKDEEKENDAFTEEIIVEEALSKAITEAVSMGGIEVLESERLIGFLKDYIPDKSSLIEIMKMFVSFQIGHEIVRLFQSNEEQSFIQQACEKLFIRKAPYLKEDDIRTIVLSVVSGTATCFFKEKSIEITDTDALDNDYTENEVQGISLDDTFVNSSHDIDSIVARKEKEALAEYEILDDLLFCGVPDAENNHSLILKLLKLGDTLVELDYKIEAETIFDGLKELAERRNTDLNSIETNRDLLNIYFVLGEYYGNKYYDESLVIAKRLAEDTSEPEDLINLSKCFIQVGDARIDEKKYEDAETDYNQSLAIVEKNQESFETKALQQMLADIYFRFGKLYNLEKKLEESEKNYNKSLSISKALVEELESEQQDRFYATVFCRIGDINKLLGEFLEAEKNYLIALNVTKTLFEETQSGRLREDLEKLYSKMASICFKQRKGEEGLKYSRLENEILREYTDKLQARYDCSINMD